MSTTTSSAATAADSQYPTQQIIFFFQDGTSATLEKRENSPRNFFEWVINAGAGYDREGMTVKHFQITFNFPNNGDF